MRLPRRAVEAVCREGPARVMELVKIGADFTRNSDGTLHLTREGGHTNRRIVHAADLTGKEIERALLDKARNTPRPCSPMECQKAIARRLSTVFVLSELICGLRPALRGLAR
jgi:aspartate oxidase